MGIKVTVEVSSKDLYKVCSTLKNLQIVDFTSETFIIKDIDKNELSNLSKNRIKWSFTNV